ncbi:tyrosine-type recombinase/integrase [Pseudomonas sp. SJZ131]|uniref:tyrosine-type recombinase/integrase n=1 Tax=Pseudomonas sp. SJZ131 TaxID=2572895 RepID=UPI0011992DBB|nr:tyrosine-type recombinase/integrase [Pseudomonas sp. SJZ131]TWD44660.1 phage integrase family protein [Pseudomonas sp. SJZ131]
MSKNNAQDDDDSFQSILDEIEREASDAADAYFSELYEASHGGAEGVCKQQLSGLVTKLAVSPNGCFPVSEYSNYSEMRWVLLRSEGFKDIEVYIDRARSDLQELKRAICYHFIPHLHPIGTIRSFRSTETYSDGFRYVQRHIFEANFLDASPEHIGVITAGVLNAALDDARDSGVMRAYWLLFFHINFWIFLSVEKLIPEEFRLQVDLNDVDTITRRKDIQEIIRVSLVGWKPFSEDELRDLLTYSFFWIDKAIPVINQVLEYCKFRPEIDKKHYSYGKRDLEFEAVIGKEVDGVVIVGFSHTPKKIKHTGIGGKTLSYDTNLYTWRKGYMYAVDRVRNAIFILFGLMTGLRRRELAPLQFDDVYKKESDGLWYVSFVRYKTSDDPNYFGEADEIPLPDYLGDAIASYKKLREFDKYMLKGYLFQPVIPTHEMNQVDRMITKVAVNLSAEVGVDGLHIHRFRKTIAEILINKSERNIDIIRMLFGHSSYVMGLRYIARNPFLVSSVVETLREHFAKDFVDILQSINSGVYAGEAANGLAGRMAGRPDIFVGKLLKLTVLEYVSHMFQGGEAVLVQRTTLSTFCMSGLIHAGESLPPCIADRANLIYPVSPDVSSCHIHCSRNLVLGSAQRSIEQNLKFYKTIRSSSRKLSYAAHFELDQKISINEKLLEELLHPKPPVIEREVSQS